jgi:hypothetical protein
MEQHKRKLSLETIKKVQAKTIEEIVNLLLEMGEDELAIFAKEQAIDGEILAFLLFNLNYGGKLFGEKWNILQSYFESLENIEFASEMISKEENDYLTLHLNYLKEDLCSSEKTSRYFENKLN